MPNTMNDWDDDELNTLNDWCIVYQVYSKNFYKTKQNSKYLFFGNIFITSAK